MKTACAIGLSVVIVLLCVSASHAALLNLTESYPLVMSSFYNVSHSVKYDADNISATVGRFAAVGTSSNFSLHGESATDMQNPGLFRMTVNITPSTGAALSGTLYLTGELDGVSTTKQVLVSSTHLVSWGFGKDDLFEAVFTEDSGSLGAVGSTIGVLIDARNISQFGPGGSGDVIPYFTADFGPSTGTKSDVWLMSNTGNVPEPATMFLVGSSVLGAVGYFRRRLMK